MYMFVHWIRVFSLLDRAPNSHTNQRLSGKPAELGPAPLSTPPTPFKTLHTGLNIMYLPSYDHSAVKTKMILKLFLNPQLYMC